MVSVNKPHTHKDVIIAYANGEIIESYCNTSETWNTFKHHGFFEDKKYRVQPKKKLYETTLTGGQLLELLKNHPDYPSNNTEEDIVLIANYAIKNFIESGGMEKYLNSLK